MPSRSSSSASFASQDSDVDEGTKPPRKLFRLATKDKLGDVVQNIHMTDAHFGLDDAQLLHTPQSTARGQPDPVTIATPCASWSLDGPWRNKTSTPSPGPSPPQTWRGGDGGDYDIFGISRPLNPSPRDGETSNSMWGLFSRKPPSPDKYYTDACFGLEDKQLLHPGLENRDQLSPRDWYSNRGSESPGGPTPVSIATPCASMTLGRSLSRPTRCPVQRDDSRQNGSRVDRSCRQCCCTTALWR